MFLFRLGFYREIKRRCRPSSDARSSLVQGSLLVNLSGVKELDESPWAVAMRDIGDMAVTSGKVEFWWQIGHHSLSPYESTMREMEHKSTSEVAGQTEVTLEACTIAKRVYYVGYGMQRTRGTFRTDCRSSLCLCMYASNECLKATVEFEHLSTPNFLNPFTSLKQVVLLAIVSGIVFVICAQFSSTLIGQTLTILPVDPWAF